MLSWTRGPPSRVIIQGPSQCLHGRKDDNLGSFQQAPPPGWAQQHLGTSCPFLYPPGLLRCHFTNGASWGIPSSSLANILLSLANTHSSRTPSNIPLATWSETGAQGSWCSCSQTLTYGLLLTFLVKPPFLLLADEALLWCPLLVQLDLPLQLAPLLQARARGAHLMTVTVENPAAAVFWLDLWRVVWGKLGCLGLV